MTREGFIEILDRVGYSYEIEGDKIIVTDGHRVDDEHLVSLNILKSLPPNVHFKNPGTVDLTRVETIPPGTVFSNSGNVNLAGVQSIPRNNVEFRNGGYIWLMSLMTLNTEEFEGNIPGINNKRLLNLMINKGLFER
jgi:hypothetical protein